MKLEAEERDKKIAQGRLSIVDAYMLENNVSRDQALEALTRIRLENAAFLMEVPTPAPGVSDA